MTPMDQADMTARSTTTALAEKPIWFHIERRSNPTSCRSIIPRKFR
jgi:hypothetical protein